MPQRKAPRGRADARDTLAVVAWTAIAAGELAPFGITTTTLGGIDVVTSTRATFDAGLARRSRSRRRISGTRVTSALAGLTA